MHVTTPDLKPLDRDK